MIPLILQGNFKVESRIGLWKWPCRADDMGGNASKRRLANNLSKTPGRTRLQGEPSSEGRYNTREDLPRPGSYFSIYDDDHYFWH